MKRIALSLFRACALVGVGIVIGTRFNQDGSRHAALPPPCPRIIPAAPPLLYPWSTPTLSLLSTQTNANGGVDRVLRLTGIRTKAAAQFAVTEAERRLGFTVIGFTNETDRTLLFDSTTIVTLHSHPLHQTFNGPTNTIRVLLDSSYAGLPDFGAYASFGDGLSRTGILHSGACEYKPLYWLYPSGTNVVQSEWDFAEEGDAPARFYTYGCLNRGMRDGTWYSEYTSTFSERYLREVWWDDGKSVGESVMLLPRKNRSVDVSFRERFRGEETDRYVGMQWQSGTLRTLSAGRERHGIKLVWGTAGTLDRIEAYVFGHPVCLASNITASLWMPTTLEGLVPSLPGETRENL